MPHAARTIDVLLEHPLSGFSAPEHGQELMSSDVLLFFHSEITEKWLPPLRKIFPKVGTPDCCIHERLLLAVTLEQCSPHPIIGQPLILHVLNNSTLSPLPARPAGPD